MSIRYVDAAERTGLQTLPCDPDRIARGFRSNERLFILPRSTKIRPVFRVWTHRAADDDPFGLALIAARRPFLG
jgi:hypothetical protein